jgi:hypothetical protein
MRFMSYSEFYPIVTLSSGVRTAIACNSGVEGMRPRKKKTGKGKADQQCESSTLKRLQGMPADEVLSEMRRLRGGATLMLCVYSTALGLSEEMPKFLYTILNHLGPSAFTMCIAFPKICLTDEIFAVLREHVKMGLCPVLKDESAGPAQYFILNGDRLDEGPGYDYLSLNFEEILQGMQTKRFIYHKLSAAYRLLHYMYLMGAPCHKSGGLEHVYWRHFERLVNHTRNRVRMMCQMEKLPAPRWSPETPVKETVMMFGCMECATHGHRWRITSVGNEIEPTSEGYVSVPLPSIPVDCEKVANPRCCCQTEDVSTLRRWYSQLRKVHW